MERDTLIGIVGGLVLLAALIGVFIYESDNAASSPRSFGVSWPVSDGPGVSASETLNEGDQHVETLEIGQANVTSVSVRLTWADDGGNPDTFSLTVTGPGGLSASPEPSDTGEISVELPVAEAPTATSIQASDQASARQSAAAQFTDTTAVGTWTITVTLESAPGQQPVPQAPQLELEPDGSNDFQLDIGYSFYRAQVAATST